MVKTDKTLLILQLSLLSLRLSLLTNGFPLFLGGFLASPLWTLVSLSLSLTFLLLLTTFCFQAFKSSVFLLATLTLLPMFVPCAQLCALYSSTLLLIDALMSPTHKHCVY
jgi:hypothetical protein